jgi:type VII secretion-associated serine protease mycosin
VTGRIGRAVLTGLLACLVGPLPATAAHADATRDKQWHLEFLEVATAHEITRGEGVTVAVIDSGVDATHPDLAGNVLPGIDLVEGRDSRTWNPADHGTGMAGLIAGHGHGQDHSNGVLGVAPEAAILPVRVSRVGAAGVGRPELIPQGLSWAIGNGADVVSISLADAQGEPYADALTEARQADVIVVAGVGNRPEATEVAYPAALPGVVAVAALDRDGSHADVSVTGPEITLAAPGVDITSTGLEHGYRIATGTSGATAIIAGAAALVRAQFPELSADEVVHRLIYTADDAGPPGHDTQYGHGIINIVAALTEDVPPLQPTPTGGTTERVADGPGDPGPGSSVTLVTVGVLVLVVIVAAAAFVAARRRPGRR